VFLVQERRETIERLGPDETILEKIAWIRSPYGNPGKKYKVPENTRRAVKIPVNL
jgi:hypothetical protein